MASKRRAEELCEYINFKSAKVSDKDDASSEQAATNGKIFRVSSTCYNTVAWGAFKLVNYYQTIARSFELLCRAISFAHATELGR